MYFALHPLKPESRVWLAVITTSCVALGAVCILLLGHAPATKAVSIFVFATLIAQAAFFAWIGIGVARAHVSVEGTHVVLSMPLYGRSINVDRIDADSLSKVDLNEAESLKPTWRTNGLSVGGLNLGWFRTRGAGTALMAMTGSDAVTWKTKDGYAVVVSVRDGDGLMRAVQAALTR